jgi:hypothetical protein
LLLLLELFPLLGLLLLELPLLGFLQEQQEQEQENITKLLF